jgi:photosystem II stability/assembly factor-like uncharacterized protein
MLKKTFYLLILLSLITIATYSQHINPLQLGKRTSIRGLSVVDDSVAWISGSRGNIATTTNGGKTWAWQQVKGFEQADFRDIEAFSDKEAVIMSSGTPALILKTIDGGANWQVKYRNTDTTYFLDAMDFANKNHGYVLGDPIKKQFVLLETKNGGETWDMFKSRPDALTGEAAFAASGTCLRVINNDIYIVSGGSMANLLAFNGKKWITTPLLLSKGKSSQGAFSIAKGKNNLIAVGGDYAKDKIRDSTVCYSTNNGKIWQLANSFPSGFQSGVEYINQNTIVSTGTSGSNISIDGGKTWTKIDAASYNVCRKAKKGKLVLLAGDGGKIGIFIP